MSDDFNIISVVRCLHRPTGAVIGRLFINDYPFCDTLENESFLISPGVYDLSLDIVSPAFCKKEPYKSVYNGCVPRLLSVPGRDGILIHIGNFAEDSRGCILVGNYYPSDKYGKNRLQESRSTFIRFFNKLKSFKFPCKVSVFDVYQ